MPGYGNLYDLGISSNQLEKQSLHRTTWCASGNLIMSNDPKRLKSIYFYREKYIFLYTVMKLQY